VIVGHSFRITASGPGRKSHRRPTASDWRTIRYDGASRLVIREFAGRQRASTHHDATSLLRSSMHQHAPRSARRPAALAAAVFLMLGPSALAAQRGPARTATIEFGRPNDTGDGYANARVDVRYQFADCVGDVAVLYAMDRASTRVAGGYYYRGRSYQLPSGFAAPRPDVVDFSGPVLNRAGQFEGSFSDPYTQGGAGAGCVGQSKVVFTRKAKLGEKSTAEQYAAFLEGLWIQPRTQPRLRDDAAESWIRGELAKQRDDSLARVAKDRERADSLARRREREVARQDSIARARDAEEAREKAASDRAAAARDSAAREDERQERREDAEQEEQDRRDAAERQASGDAQTERLNAMFAVEKGEWARAEAAYARGDLETARPLYEKLAGSLVYGDQAKARLAKLNEQQLAEGIGALFSVVGYFNSKLEGTGLFLGPSYAPTGFPGDKGAAGLTVGFVTTPQQRWVPYVDLLLFSMGSDDAKSERYMPGETISAAAIGTTTPWLKLSLGRNATLAPHFGYRAIGTDLRWVNVAQTGLMLVTRGMLLRADAVIIDGRVQANGAIARVF
jgi:hypothetical protein